MRFCGCFISEKWHKKRRAYPFICWFIFERLIASSCFIAERRSTSRIADLAKKTRFDGFLVKGKWGFDETLDEIPQA